jgi:hypothetical protein
MGNTLRSFILAYTDVVFTLIICEPCFNFSKVFERIFE